MEEFLLGSLLTALNISLKETIQSTQSMRNITFGDKAIIIAPGEIITSFLIVSDLNFISKAIANHINNSFENQFKQQLLNENYSFDQFQDTT